MKKETVQDNTARFRRQVCFPIYLCAKELTGRYNQILKAYDLTYTQYIVMNYFWEMGHSNLKEVGRALMLDASTLTPLLQKLEAKGFVQRKTSDKDKRNLEITLTEKGKALQKLTADVPERATADLTIDRESAVLLHDLAKGLIDELRQKE